jgi:protein translocase SecG subunit
MLSIAINVLLVIHVLVSLLIILLTLMQRPKNEGLGAAFGGGMTENLFGAQTTNVLQTMTRYLGAAFFALTVILSWLYVKETHQKGTLQKRLLAPTAVPAAATPAPGAATPAPVPVEKSTDEKKPEAPAGASAPEKPAATTPAATPVPAPAAASPAPATPVPPKPAPEVEAAKPPVATPAPAPAAAPAGEKPAENKPAESKPSGENKPAGPAPEKPGN